MSGAMLMRPTLLSQLVRRALGMQPLPIMSVKWERVGVRRQMLGTDRIVDYRLTA